MSGIDQTRAVRLFDVHGLLQAQGLLPLLCLICMVINFGILFTGSLSSSFPIENRITTVTLKALKNHMDRTKHLPFVRRISDFHLLLLLSRFLDANADVPALAECVRKQATVPEGYQLLIESLAAST